MLGYEEFSVQLLILGTVFFCWSMLVTPFSIRLSERYRIVDHPGGRKRHEGRIPRGSGVVFWIGYLLLALFLSEEMGEIRLIGTGATIVFFLGYMDDMKGLSPAGRLFGHMIAAGLVVLLIPLPPVRRVFLFLWITGGISAYNLIDGMNGLALSIFSMTCLFAAAIGRPIWWVPLFGMAAGMFYWNFPVARTFLGDGGSTLLGFLCMSQFAMDLSSTLGDLHLPAFCAGLLLVGGIPFIDTVLSILRRLLARKSPFAPDRGHIHHVLLDRGMPQTVVLLVLLALHGVCVAGGLLLMAP